MKKERPVLKVVVIFLSVSALGLFLGWTMERMFYGDPHRLEDEAELPVHEPLVVQSSSEPTRWELDTVHRAVEGLPAYPGAAPQPLASDYLGPDAPIAVAWFTTKDTPNQVLDFYQNQFVDAGVLGTQQRPNENGGYVAYMVPNTGVMRVITALKQGAQTVVFASNGNLIPAFERSPHVPPDLPHPPGAMDTLVMNLNQERFGDVSIVASVEGTDIGRWVTFYEEGFTQRGWKVQQVIRPNEREAQVEATHERRRAMALIRRADQGSRIEILVRVSGEA